MRKFDNPFFGELAKEAWALAVWEWLNDPIRVAKMIAVSEMGHPALEGVVHDLEAEFGDADGEDRFGPAGDRNRQLVGAMIRQVMEAQRWIVDRQGLKIALGHQFTVATRYKQMDRPVAAPTGGDSKRPFLQQVAERFGVQWRGRHYIEIACDGVTIGVDDLSGGPKAGTRRVHAFSNRKSRAAELVGLDPVVHRVAAELSRHLHPVNRLGVASHQRRYVGWEWAKGQPEMDEVELACKLVEALYDAWLRRATQESAAS